MGLNCIRTLPYIINLIFPPDETYILYILFFYLNFDNQIVAVVNKLFQSCLSDLRVLVNMSLVIEATAKVMHVFSVPK